MFKRKLSDKIIKKIYDDASQLLNTGHYEDAVETLTPLIKAQKTNKNAADALIKVVRRNELPEDTSINILNSAFESYQNDPETLSSIALSLEAVSNINDLNEPPPENDLLKKTIAKLTEQSLAAKNSDKEADIIEALSSLCRVMSHQYVKEAEKHYARLIELLPNKAWTHYNQGLFFKTTGRFSEGMAANQTAINIYQGDDPEPYLWNLGICATAAHQGQAALDTWKKLGNKIEMGRFNLPEGRYPSCKVRLAQRPCAERDANNDTPGKEETIWIERLSPCHGIIRSVLYHDIGADYGDVILFDGAPITTHKYGDQDIPVFPHLATLINREYHFYDFAATQQNTGEINNLDKNFENDVVIYSHTENFKTLCTTCWQNKDIDHDNHDETENHNVVTGRIAAPPDISAEQLLNQIDGILKDKPENRIFAPDLCIKANQPDRAKIEQNRYDTLINA